MTKGGTMKSRKETQKTSKKMTIGQVLGEVLQNARDTNRLTCGLYDSGLMLEMNPDSVMMCVLPMDKSNDVTLDIHYTLIEAFCLENGVRLIRVDSSEKLQKLLGERNAKRSVAPNNPHVGDANENFYLDDFSPEWDGFGVDYNCVLVEYPEECSEPEGDVLDYHKHTCVEVPQPIINLDV